MSLLELKGVQVEFSGFVALSALDFAVEKGELRCLIGPNGAGKTTALDVICGKVQAVAGTVIYSGHNIGRLQEHQVSRLGIARKFQVPSVFRELTVRDNLDVAYSKHPGVFRTMFTWRRGGVDDGLSKLAEFVGLKEQFNLSAGALSHGQTQWLEIAMLLAQDAELILMDEPTAGMTAQETHKTAELLNRLKGRHTIIVVEHDMGFIKEVADVISVMHQGRLLAQGTVSEIEQHAEVKSAYLGSGGIRGA